jgi:hypothetical protein
MRTFFSRPIPGGLAAVWQQGSVWQSSAEAALECGFGLRKRRIHDANLGDDTLSGQVDDRAHCHAR